MITPSSILTDTQRQYLQQEAAQIRGLDRFADEMRRRRALSEELRGFIHQTGVLEGRALDEDGLVQLVRLVWQIQELNPIVLPRLLGTYTYYRHFKDFQGSEADFVAHMREKRPGFTEGYEGADLQAFSRDLRALLSTEGADHAKALHAFMQQPGVQRAFATGALLLYRPDQYPLINSAAIGPFKNPGPLHISRAKRKEVRDRIRGQVGRLPGKAIPTLSWVEMLRGVRTDLECDDFLELDWILWQLSTKLAGQAKASLEVEPADSAPGKQPVDPDALIEDIPAEAVAIRQAAEQEARELIEGKLGRLTSDDLRQLLRLLNRDFHRGKEVANRFSPAFTGSTAAKICERPEAANRWIERLWHASEDDIPQLLEEFWASKELPGAGRSFPTAILYLRDPSKYQVLTGGLYRGYARVVPEPIRNPRKSGQRYLEYNRGLNDLRVTYGFPPQATDALLWRATQVAETTETYGAPQFRGFTRETFAVLAELAENNNDTWFKDNQQRFRTHVREPLRSLIAELGEKVIAPLGDHIERTPKSPETLSRIRKNIYGKAPEGAYWVHSWAAFHRVGRDKSEDFQLAVFLRGDQVAFGFATASASRQDREHFAQQVRRFPELTQVALDAVAAREGLHFRVGAEPGEEREIAAPTNPEALATLITEQPFMVSVRLASSDAIVQQPEVLLASVADALHAAYPLFALATADDPVAAIDAFQSIQWEGDEAGDAEDAEEDTYTEDRFLSETLLSPDELSELQHLLDDKRQLILYGPPGTGKTYLAERLARLMAGASGTVRTVQFHPSYGYEDFVEGIRPKVVDGTMQYQVEAGIFRKLCDEARRRPQVRHVLIIDEINRGNLPRIFGELLYALERRDTPVVLPVSSDRLRVPPNLYLIGTMNSADHSIALVDVALRRRFHFFRLDPSEERLQRWLSTHRADMRWVARLLKLLNDELDKAGIDRDMWIGHSHFMHPKLDENHLARIWDRSILPTLEEYFYGRRAQLETFEDLWSSFQDEAPTAAPAHAEADAADDEDDDEEAEDDDTQEAAQ